MGLELNLVNVTAVAQTVFEKLGDDWDVSVHGFLIGKGVHPSMEVGRVTDDSSYKLSVNAWFQIDEKGHRILRIDHTAKFLDFGEPTAEEEQSLGLDVMVAEDAISSAMTVIDGWQ